jgi:hypothetical protein
LGNLLKLLKKNDDSLIQANNCSPRHCDATFVKLRKDMNESFTRILFKTLTAARRSDEFEKFLQAGGSGESKIRGKTIETSLTRAKSSPTGLNSERDLTIVF